MLLQMLNNKWLKVTYSKCLHDCTVSFIWPVGIFDILWYLCILLLKPILVSTKHSKSFNPILTGGGGQFDPPPAQNPRLCRDRRCSRHAFSWLFSFKSYASFDTKFAKIGPSVARSRNFLYSHVGSKLAQNPYFAYVYVQNTWKLLIFLKCSKSVFILSFWPFAQFLISWN